MNDNTQQFQADPPEYLVGKCESISVVREAASSPSPFEWSRLHMAVDRDVANSSVVGPTSAAGTGIFDSILGVPKRGSV